MSELLASLREAPHSPLNVALARIAELEAETKSAMGFSQNDPRLLPELAKSLVEDMSLAHQSACEGVDEANKRIVELEAVCNRTLSWLGSFSMPPTSTIQEKQEAMADLEAVLQRREVHHGKR